MPWQLMTSSASRSTGATYRNTRILYFGVLLLSLAIFLPKPSKALTTPKSDLIYGADFLSLLMAISSESGQEPSQNRPPVRLPEKYAQLYEYKDEGSTTTTKLKEELEIIDKKHNPRYSVEPPKLHHSNKNITSRQERPLAVEKERISLLVNTKGTTLSNTEGNATLKHSVDSFSGENLEKNKKVSRTLKSSEESDRTNFKKNISADIETGDTLRHLLMRYLQMHVEPQMPLKVLGNEDFKDQAQSILIANIGKENLVDNSIDKGYVRNSRSTDIIESSNGDKLAEIQQHSDRDAVEGTQNSEHGQHTRNLQDRGLDYEEYPARVRPLQNPHFSPTSSSILDRDLDKKLQQTIIYHDNQPITHTRSISYSSVIQSLPQVGLDQANTGQHERRERNYNTGQHFTNSYDNLEKKLNDTAKLYGNEDIPRKDLLAHPWTQHTKNDGDITTDTTMLSNQDGTWNKQVGTSDSFTTQKPWEAPKALPYILPTPLTTTYGVQTPPNILFGHQKQTDKQNVPENAYDDNAPKTTSQIYFGHQSGQAQQDDLYRPHEVAQNGPVSLSGNQYGHQLSDSSQTVVSKDSFGLRTVQPAPGNPYESQQGVLDAHGSSQNILRHQTGNHNSQDRIYNTNIQVGPSTADLYGGHRIQQNRHGSSQGPYEDGKPLQSERSGHGSQTDQYGHFQSQKRGQHEHSDGYRSEKQLPTVYARPEQNYEVEEAISLVTNGRAHGVHQPTSTPKEEHYNAKKLDDNQKVGYVVEGRNYKKYRVEERTSDGFIVGEYGVVSHNDGSLRGVRYTADGTINPKVISEALMKFLSL